MVMIETLDSLAVGITRRLLQLALLAEALRYEAKVSSFNEAFNLLVHLVYSQPRGLEKEAVHGVVTEMSPRVRLVVGLPDEGVSKQNISASGNGAKDVHDLVFEITKVQDSSEMVQVDILVNQAFGL